MKTAVQVLASFLLFSWILAAMTAPMMLGAPGASNQLSKLLTVLVVVSYPLVIGVVFYCLGWNLLWFSPKGLLLTTCCAPLLAVFFLGVPIANTLRGIANEGDTVTASAVYIDGKKAVGADPLSFERLSDFYSKDRARVYHNGRGGGIAIVENADARSFEVNRSSPDEGAPRYDARDKFRRYLDGRALP